VHWNSSSLGSGHTVLISCCKAAAPLWGCGVLFRPPHRTPGTSMLYPEGTAYLSPPMMRAVSRRRAGRRRRRRPGSGGVVLSRLGGTGGKEELSWWRRPGRARIKTNKDFFFGAVRLRSKDKKEDFFIIGIAGRRRVPWRLKGPAVANLGLKPMLIYIQPMLIVKSLRCGKNYLIYTVYQFHPLF
jgi:hypothetical protein